MQSTRVRSVNPWLIGATAVAIAAIVIATAAWIFTSSSAPTNVSSSGNEVTLLASRIGMGDLRAVDTVTSSFIGMGALRAMEAVPASYLGMGTLRHLDNTTSTTLVGPMMGMGDIRSDRAPSGRMGAYTGMGDLRVAK